MLKKVYSLFCLLLSTSISAIEIDDYFRKNATDLIINQGDSLERLFSSQCKQLKSILPEKIGEFQQKSAYTSETLDKKLPVSVITSIALIPCLDKGHISTYNIKRSNLGKFNVVAEEMKEIYQEIRGLELEYLWYKKGIEKFMKERILYYYLQRLNYHSDDLLKIALEITEE